jgi:hypothetical protein
MKEAEMKRMHSTDFDVITGPSMASACPIVETVPPGQEQHQQSLPETAEEKPAKVQADAA